MEMAVERHDADLLAFVIATPQVSAGNVLGLV
jgi:hypothetical protein